MKFEALILRGLFVACIAVCGLILAAMLDVRPSSVNVAPGTSIATLLISAPSTCMLPLVDDMICVRAAG
ncbi:hypothetical protein DWU98_08820 [Dyella monticola]|uniref:Uncharacterized protein n=1 Tax=Dyella monticola TaxID=1927958 RepID=A0A370X1I2_9GAMM|nr:hypothetical protein [Dyella monticola]RDS82140.1 hypothetical protein DWU98_08820 [Dyella monticola]